MNKQPQLFFDQHSPEEAKAKLWEWFTIAVTGSFEKLCVTEKEDLVTLYEQVRDLVEGLTPSTAPRPPEGGGDTQSYKGEEPPGPLKGEALNRNKPFHE